jgi:hypothetical protein
MMPAVTVVFLETVPRPLAREATTPAREGGQHLCLRRGYGGRVRIPLILISHSGRSRSPIPVILITLFTVPEEGTADSMTWRGQLPLTV